MPSPEAPPELVALFICPLNALGVQYMVTGAVAATIYGEPRLTNDIDLVIALAAADAGALAAAFDAATALKADFYPVGVDALHQWALARRQTFVVGGIQVWVAPPEYVIIRKLEYLRDSGSDKHSRDIRAMLLELGEGVDLPVLLSEIRQRNLMALWRTVTEAGPRA